MPASGCRDARRGRSRAGAWKGLGAPTLGQLLIRVFPRCCLLTVGFVSALEGDFKWSGIVSATERLFCVRAAVLCMVCTCWVWQRDVWLPASKDIPLPLPGRRVTPRQSHQTSSTMHTVSRGGNRVWLQLEHSNGWWQQVARDPAEPPMRPPWLQLRLSFTFPAPALSAHWALQCDGPAPRRRARPLGPTPGAVTCAASGGCSSWCTSQPLAALLPSSASCRAGAHLRVAAHA